MQKLSELVGRPLRIFLLTQDEELAASFQSLWPTDQLTWTVFSDGQHAMEQVITEPPDIIIAEQFFPELNGVELLRTLKEENVYRQICAILIVREEHIPDLLSVDVRTDALIILPASESRLRVRTELGLKRITSTLDANPLTRLPGNTSIINATQRLLSNGAPFALAYVDMDNFKPYNDKYGFSRGDEMLLMTARLIVNTVNAQQSQPSFVGHIGGDDFVFILPIEEMEQACERLISDFDAIAPSFYDHADRERKSILSIDRRGQKLAFPIISISIAVVLNVDAKFTHYAQLSHVAGQLKKIAKATLGSSYVIDRRQH